MTAHRTRRGVGQSSTPSVKNKVLNVICADKVSKTWLIREVEGLRHWEGAEIKVIDSRDLPKPVKRIAWIQGVSEEPSFILKRIDIQNPTLKVQDWTIIDVKKDPKSTQFILSMGPSIVEHIEKIDVELIWG